MKYIVIEIQKFANGTISTLTNAYDSLNAAESKYHTVLAAAAISELPTHSAVLMNENGYVIRSQSYNHGEVSE